MDIKNFTSGKYIKQYQYQSFSPEPVNHSWVVSDPALNKLLSEADLKLGALNAFSQLIPDVDFFIRMHVAKEATQSSKIEGTKTNIEEALQSEAYINPEKKDDWQEVHNYIDAMNHSIVLLKKLPVSNRLLKEAHKILLRGVRGKHKLPGEFRASQNWIGGSSLQDAAFIPPHHQDVPALMSDLEKFINNEDLPVPHLIRIGITHYQFETIHPFLDGNGRLGRLLITLYLVNNNILHKPALYLSDFFERNRASYYDKLTAARTRNDLHQWLTFFLVGVQETAQNGIDTFNKIIQLRAETEEKMVSSLGRRLPRAKQLLNYLYSNPVIGMIEISKELNMDVSTAQRLIKDFENLNILKEKTGFKRNRIFVFEKYLKLFERN
jgi:Fic family protein